jgi:mono/diheme cytochrome c family protein
MPIRSIFFLSLFVVGSVLWSQNLNYTPDPQWQPPPQAVKRRNPLADRPQLAAGGRKLFLRHCAECHGNDGRGVWRKNAADFELPVVQEQTDGALFWKITNGNQSRGMPTWSELPELQRWQLVLFVRTLNKEE